MKLLSWPSVQGLLRRSNEWFVLTNHKARVFSQPEYTRSTTAPERMIATLFSHTLLTVLYSFFQESRSFPKGLCTWLSKQLVWWGITRFKKGWIWVISILESTERLPLSRFDSNCCGIGCARHHVSWWFWWWQYAGWPLIGFFCCIPLLTVVHSFVCNIR